MHFSSKNTQQKNKKVDKYRINFRPRRDPPEGRSSFDPIASGSSGVRPEIVACPILLHVKHLLILFDDSDGATFFLFFPFLYRRTHKLHVHVARDQNLTPYRY
jgi:hypothetical protein